MLIALSGCGKWLDVRPYDEISEQDLFSNADGFRKLLNGVYIELCNDELYGLSMGSEMLEVMGGSYEIGTDANVWGQYVDLSRYDYGSEYWRMRFSAVWNGCYKNVLNCNKIVSNIDSKNDIFPKGEYELIKGEALALRALLHFDMLRMFGPVYSKDPSAPGIPVYKEVTLQPNERLSAEEALAEIIYDLTEARSLLSDDPILTEGVQAESAPDGNNFLRYRNFRLNYHAVTALLARAYLWAGEKQSALRYAKEVIDASATFPFVAKTDVVGTDDPDRVFSSELVFALTTSKRNNLFLNYFSATRTTFTFKMEPALISNIIYGGGSQTGGYQDDYRSRVCWNSSGSSRYFVKYAPMNTVGDIRTTMLPMIRMGEMYLIAAECTEDVSYINTLRRARGLNQNLPGFDQSILEYEYMRELYGEGQIFYMHKRRNTDIIRSANASRNVPASDDVFVCPLPDTEKFN